MGYRRLWHGSYLSLGDRVVQAIEWWAQRFGAVALLATLATVLCGLWSASGRPKGRETGGVGRILRRPFYVVASTLYFALCYALWRPLPLTLSPAARAVALALGSALYFPGVGLVLWARLTLGAAYNASLSSGAQLRHPMYTGINLAALGGLLLYRTWTFVFALSMLALVKRARREEEVLAVEFGAHWEEYRRRVPGWIPRLRR
jgi:hypothetical protein